MNVGHPSNLARFFDLYGGTVDRNGVVHRMPDVAEMRKRIYSVSISDRETKKTIKRIYDQYKVLLEPHGAVGWRGLEVYLELFGDSPLCVSLETAHPAKFPDEIRELLAIEPRPAAEHEGSRLAVGPAGLPPGRLRRIQDLSSEPPAGRGLRRSPGRSSPGSGREATIHPTWYA